MAAEVVSPELRANVRTARNRGVRCLRTAVEEVEAEDSLSEGAEAPKGGKRRTLLLAQATPGLPEASLEKEFQRCVTEVLPRQPPCLLLFRTDQKENVEGCRWLLVVWLPATAREVERAACVHSRGLLSCLVPQPYFLRELFACGPHELSWRAACEAWARSKGLSDVPRTQPPRVPAVGSVQGPAGPAAPLNQGPALQALLGRLARREDPCVRLVLIGSTRLRSGMLGATILEGKPCDSRSPAHLAKAGLPMSACYFVLFSREDLCFVHWCPEGNVSKDTSRIHDDARYAILKAVVLKTVMAAFPSPQPKVLNITARDPQDIIDGVNKASAGDAAPLPHPRLATRSATSAEADRSWPVGAPVADWPDHWPAAATSATFPASLILPQRPVPYWRGGTRSGTISALASAPGAATRHAKINTAATRFGTGHFKESH